MIDDSDELGAASLPVQYLYLTYIYAMSWVIIVVVIVSRSYRQLISPFLIQNRLLLRDDWLYHEAKILFICVKLNTDIPCLDLRGQILFFCLCEGDQYQISQVAVSIQLTNNTQVLDRLDVLFFRIVLIQNINNIAITHPTMGNEHICRNCQEDHDDHSILPSSIQARAIVNVLPHHKQPLPKKNHPLVTLNQHEKQKEPQIQSLDFKINSTYEENSIDVPESIRLFTGKGRIQYQPGWVYEGDLVLGVREGQGRMTWPNGDYYEGIFQQGRANGHGLFQLTNGIKYSGQFSNDEIRLGKRVSQQDREIYQGAFKNRQLDGYGVLIVRDEFQYKGLFRRNQMEGSGQMKYKDGSSYVGEFREGKKHGYGLWISCNGSRYEGYWFQGERDGVGTFIGRDGERRQKKFERGRQVEL